MRDDRLDLNVFLNKIILKKKKLSRVFIVTFLVFCIYTVFFYKKDYKSRIVFLPNISSSSSIMGARLGGVAALAGINLGENSQKDISPELYVNILNSNTFLDKLSKSHLTTFNDKGEEIKMTYKEYYKIHNPEPILSKIKKSIGFNKSKGLNTIRNEDIKRYSNEDINVFKSLQNSLSFNYNSKENLVTIESTLNEALPSSELLLSTVNLLKEDLSKIKSLKTKTELEFIEKRYEEKLEEFKSIQHSLAAFEDRNQYLKSSRSKTRLMNLRTNYELLFNICSELQKQIETKKIHLKENTLYITVIEPITIPNEKSGLRKSLMLVIGGFLSFFVVIFYVFIEDFYVKIRKRST